MYVKSGCAVGSLKEQDEQGAVQAKLSIMKAHEYTCNGILAQLIQLYVVLGFTLYDLWVEAWSTCGEI